jgi:RNase P subunit RPR2
MTVIIERKLVGPTTCPTCNAGGDQLFVATKGGPTPSSPFRKQSVKWLGYDCKGCGEQLRFASDHHRLRER